MCEDVKAKLPTPNIESITLKLPFLTAPADMKFELVPDSAMTAVCDMCGNRRICYWFRPSMKDLYCYNEKEFKLALTGIDVCRTCMKNLESKLE